MTRNRHRIYTQSNGVGFQNFQPPTRGPCVNKDQSIRLWTTLILNKILGNLLLCWALKQVVKVILKRRKKVHMSPHLNVISVSKKIFVYLESTSSSILSIEYFGNWVSQCICFGLLRKFCNTFLVVLFTAVILHFLLWNILIQLKGTL